MLSLLAAAALALSYFLPSAITPLLAPDIHHRRAVVRYSGAIMGTRSKWKVVLVALLSRINGFAQVKAKVGLEGSDDAARLRRIRRGLGWNIDLRVDANEAWHAAEAADRIRALLPFQIAASVSALLVLAVMEAMPI